MQNRLDYETLDRLLAQTRGRSHVPCPICGPRHRRVKAKPKIWRGNKAGVFTYARCGVHGVAFANGHTRQSRRAYTHSGVPASADDGEARRRYASSIAHASRPAAGTLVETYLKSRAITLLPSRARFHPKLKHASGQCWPAMVVPIIDAAGSFCGVRRTYLAHDGKDKAPLDPNKLTLGPIAGTGAWLVGH